MAVIVRLIPPTSVLLVLVLLCMPGTWADYEKKPRGHSVYFIPESQASEKSYTVSKSLEVSDDREPRPESDSYSNVLSDGHSAEEEPVPDPEVYEFEYGVKDNSTGQVFSHKEGREGPDTQGEYRVLLPDGRYQIVEYTADKLGYRAKVSFEGDKTQSYPGSTPRPSYTPPPQYFQRRQAKKIEAPASHLYNSTHIASDHYIKVYHPPRKSVLHEATKQEYHETVNDQYLSGTRYTRPPPPSTPISETYVPPPSPEYQPPHPAPIYDLPTTTTTTISPPPVEYPQPPPIYPPPLAHRAVPAYATAPPPAYTPPPPPPVYYTTTITTTTPKPSYYSSSAKKESESHESNSTYYTVEVNGKGEDDGPPIQVIVKPHNVISITYSRPHANQPQTHIQVQHNSAVNTSDSVSESYSQSQHTHTHKATSYKPITVSRPVYVKTSADASSSTRTSTNHHYISEASQSHEVVTTADYAPSAHVYHTYKGPVISIPSYKAHTVHHHHQTNGQPYGSHEANYDLVIGYNKNYQPIMLSCPRVYLLLLIQILQHFTRVPICWGIQMKDMEIPSYVKEGGKAVISCNFDLEGIPLYAVKWYKDNTEFYRFVPHRQPSIQTFRVSGIQIDVSGSNASTILLRDVDLRTTGLFRCEAITEGPAFRTVVAEASMQVVAPPEKPPIVEGLRDSYGVGEWIRANCTSYPSQPPASLMWYIRENMAPREMLREYLPLGVSRGLEVSRLGLEMKVRDQGIQGTLLKCTASISNIYWESVTILNSGVIRQGMVPLCISSASSSLYTICFIVFVLF
ncbi:unnamed protein product [Darwinula stevensoni]|uniref:Ig-like domain-containing protein n=1 Tax=Darwinula stevensoni TaxID=69355 RepID=A0A7R9A467_9CRUS|nr:unnamed protein product [Darwinula stevensoni]CAG0882759.1 unnamed protein product [Darwinula stevensoni]